MKLGPQKAAPTPAEDTPHAGDKIGAFPRDYDTDALPERRTAAFARMMSIVAAVEAFAIAGLAFAIAALMPLQKVVPMVVTSNDKGNEIVHINPATLDAPTIDYVSEISLRNFVEKRYSILGSAGAQAANWDQGSVVQLMSNAEGYKAFMDQARPEFMRLRGENKIRSVRIDSVRKLSASQWQVEYVTSDQVEHSPMQGATPSEDHQWISTFEITFEPKNVTYNDRLNNPFGMTVKKVTDARRD